jgi:hypothetical protein
VDKVGRVLRVAQHYIVQRDTMVRLVVVVLMVVGMVGRLVLAGVLALCLLPALALAYASTLAYEGTSGSEVAYHEHAPLTNSSASHGLSSPTRLVLTSQSITTL